MLFTTSGYESECPTTKAAPIEFVTIEHHCDGKTDAIHNRLTADEENPPKSYTTPVIHPPKRPKMALLSSVGSTELAVLAEAVPDFRPS